MYSVRTVTDDLYWVGANDHRLALFENAYPIPRGVSHNAYLLMDEKTALFDTVSWTACRQLLENVNHVLEGRPLDYLVINHWEPDHGGSLEELLLRWPNITVISNENTFLLMRQFDLPLAAHATVQVTEGDSFCFGAHTVTFLLVPMAHWPAMMVTFDRTSGVLFSADALGAFGALDGKLFADEVDFDRDWLDDARRYLTGIVGKYGPQVSLLLQKTGSILDQIRCICPLHGPVWRRDLMYLIRKYHLWSRYRPEKRGVLIVYASPCGNTESIVQALAARLCDKGMTEVSLYDISSTHVSQLISASFQYSHMILAGVTCHQGIYPAMHSFLLGMKALDVQNRTVAIVENGVTAGDLIQTFLTDEMKHITVLNERLRIASTPGADKAAEMELLADAMIASLQSSPL